MVSYGHIKLTCQCMNFVQRTRKKKKFLVRPYTMQTNFIFRGLLQNRILSLHVDNIVVGFYIHAG